jgi:hypothetical protein
VQIKHAAKNRQGSSGKSWLKKTIPSVNGLPEKKMVHLLVLWQPLLLILLHGVGNGGEGHDRRLLRIPGVHQDLRDEGPPAAAPSLLLLLLLLQLLLLLLQLMLLAVAAVAAAQVQQLVSSGKKDLKKLSAWDLFLF